MDDGFRTDPETGVTTYVQPEEDQGVVITGIDVTFVDLVRFVVKLTFASMVAAPVVLAIIYMAVMMFKH